MKIKTLTKTEKKCIKAKDYGFKQGIKKAEQFVDEEIDSYRDMDAPERMALARLRRKLIALTRKRNK